MSSYLTTQKYCLLILRGF